jgi:3-oxoacyl-[acyl-carrier protein] reductase
MKDTAALGGFTALVTGASRGIGRAITLQLAKNGASVAVNYVRSETQARSVVSELRCIGARAEAFRADVSIADDVSRLVSEVESTLGPIDILVCNAGQMITGDLGSYDPEDFAAMWNLNVGSIVLLTNALREGMRQRMFGRVVVVGSVAGLGTSFPGNTLYATTKAAAMLLTRRLAAELGPQGITVNVVAPGFIETDMAKGAQDDEKYQATVAWVEERTALRRIGQPEDVAHAVAFLASPAAGFITAQVIAVDGGRMDYLNH